MGKYDDVRIIYAGEEPRLLGLSLTFQCDPDYTHGIISFDEFGDVYAASPTEAVVIDSSVSVDMARAILDVAKDDDDVMMVLVREPGAEQWTSTGDLSHLFDLRITDDSNGKNLLNEQLSQHLSVLSDPIDHSSPPEIDSESPLNRDLSDRYMMPRVIGCVTESVEKATEALQMRAGYACIYDRNGMTPIGTSGIDTVNSGEDSLVAYSLTDVGVSEYGAVRLDARFDSHPIVEMTDSDYALVAPVLDSEGTPVGALCLLDGGDRDASELEMATLQRFAAEVAEDLADHVQE